ncbi:MAG: hypothetical protein JRH17_23805 [Deltaproteobacteria bacterium]|nr:hypothetical protein [Deltaproteobacteria bacterium]
MLRLTTSVEARRAADPFFAPLLKGRGCPSALFPVNRILRERSLRPALPGLFPGLLLVLGLSAAAAWPSGAQRFDAGPIHCREGSAIVTGPPARELFDPYTPHSGHASWCERYDHLGRPRRQGAYRDFHPDGSPRSYARFHNDQLSGVLLILHDNGRPWLHTVYRAGRLHGPYVVFTPLGAPWIEAEYESGSPVGRHIVYFEAGGISAVSEYWHGSENGVSRSWYANGQLRQEIEVVKGVWSGRFSSWYENGHVAHRGYYAPCPPGASGSSCQYLGAARHGPWRTWHANGTQASQGKWRFGERIGRWLYWTTAGEPVATDVGQSAESPAAEPEPPASPAPRLVPQGAAAAGATAQSFRLRH